MSSLALFTPGGGNDGDVPQIPTYKVIFKDNSVYASGVHKYSNLILLGPDVSIRAGDWPAPEIVTGEVVVVEARKARGHGTDFYVYFQDRDEAFTAGADVTIQGPFDVSTEILPPFLTFTENLSQPYPPEGPGPEAKYVKFIKWTFGDEQKTAYAKARGYDSYEEYFKATEPAGGAA